MCHQSVEDPWLLMSVLARLLLLLSAFLGHSSGLASRSGDRDGCLAGDTESLQRVDQSEGGVSSIDQLETSILSVNQSETSIGVFVELTNQRSVSSVDKLEVSIECEQIRDIY